MRAWITWTALLPFVLAVDGAVASSGTVISFSGTSSVDSSASGPSIYVPPTSTSAASTSVPSTLSVPSVSAVPSSAAASSFPAPIASGPATQPQSIIPISPTSFSPFPVPSDVPIVPGYPAVDPSQPPPVSYTSLLVILALTRSDHLS